MSYVFLDLETTGLDSDICYITEVAAVRTNDYGDVMEEFHTMVRLPEGESVPELITKLTGITDEMLKDGVSQQKAMLDLARFIGDDIVVAQYAPFDLSFIERHFQVMNFYDTRTMAYALELPSAKLVDIAKHYGFEQEEAHRALSDAHDCRKVFFEMVEEFARRGESAGELMNVVGTKPERIPKRYPLSTIAVVDYGEEKAGE